MRIGLIAALLAVLSFATPAQAAGRGKGVLSADRPIAGQYVVVLNDDADVEAQAHFLAGKYNATVGAKWSHALKGFVAHLSRPQAEALANDPSVALVQEDGIVQIDTTQTPVTWGLDRIDQHYLPLDNQFIYFATGAGVTAYVIDTGIDGTHPDFAGHVASGVDYITPGGNGWGDCNGHGTHVAGTIGSQTYGVAKNVTLVPVRVLDCGGSGPWSTVISGVNWVTSNHLAGQPAVANMSLSGGAYSPLDTAVNNSIADGVTYAVAAGNSGAIACNYSPARVANAITVGATDSTDTRASWSNYGTCVDLFCPGVNITSLWLSGGTNTISGTSMASPHAAGIAAATLQNYPTWTPAQVAADMIYWSTLNVVINPGAGSPNRLCYHPY